MTNNELADAIGDCIVDSHWCAEHDFPVEGETCFLGVAAARLRTVDRMLAWVETHPEASAWGATEALRGGQ